MPGATTKGSSCCIGGDPPSPTGLAPRPISPPKKSPDNVGKKPAKHITQSWSTVEAAELRAIFEDEEIDPRQKIHQTIPQSDLQLDAVIEGDDKVETEDDITEIKGKKSSSTLKAVTEKLKKHLSRESALNKRFSRSSVGTSEEEIERRAELRRIRERRIREELSNEGVYDADAKSVLSITDPVTPLLNDRPYSWIPGNFEPLPVLIPPSALPIANPAEPHPLEMPLAALSACAEDMTCSSTPRPRSNPGGSTEALVHSAGTLSRRHSMPSGFAVDNDCNHPRLYIPSRKRSSLPPIPQAPSLHAQRLPSIPEPVRSGWRLSFASEKRGEHLRKLSREYVPPSLDVERLGSPIAPMSHWLRTQGLRVPSQAINSSEGEPSSCPAVSSLQGSEDLAGIDGNRDHPTHLHEMEISRLLSSPNKRSETSSPQLSSWESHQHGASSISGSSRPLERSRSARNTTSDSLPARTPRYRATLAEELPSSFYPSEESGIQPSPASSRFNLLSKLKISKSRGTMDGVRAPEPLQASLSSPMEKEGRVTPSHSSNFRHDWNRRGTIDDSSAVLSDTDSFRQREAELNFIQTRFVSVPGTPTPSTPKSSKFREEFEADPEPVKLTDTRKQSIFARFARIGTKSYDGASNMEELLDIPMPSFKPEILLSADAVDPFSGNDEAENAWGLALQNKGGGKANDVANSLQIPGGKAGLNTRRSKSLIKDEAGTKSAVGIFSHLRPAIVKKKVERGAAEEYQERMQERLAVKELVMDSWEAEMEATASKAKAKSRNIVKKTKPSAPDKRYPASWARFASHNRDERTSSATAQPDRVEIKDFAKLGMENSEIVWCLAHDEDNDVHLSVLEDVNKKKALGVRVKDRAAHAVYKSQTADEQSAQTRGQRGSLSIASELEYPELEILPLLTVLRKTHEELAQEVREEKKHEEEEAKLEELRLMGLIDGSSDGKEIYAMHSSAVSIADPNFYSDCVFDPAMDESEDLTRSFKRSKYRTWSGKDWEKFKTGKKMKKRYSMDVMGTRRSTDEYLMEVKEMEKSERERVLRTVDELWGSQ